MKKNGLIALFILVGLSIFSYPFIANYVSTTGYVKTVNGYEEKMRQLSDAQKKEEARIAKEHNDKIKEEELTYVDPFSNGTEEGGAKSYYDALHIGDVMAVLDIPKLHLSLPIYHGSGDKVLSQGVGHLENSALPIGEEGTHSVLTAHRGLPSAKLFRYLDDLVKGDIFYITVLDEIHAYEVFDTKVVLPDETDWLQQDKEKEVVTLLTCDPYMLNTHRLLVFGQRIPYEAEEITISRESRSKQMILLVAAILLVVLLLLFLYTWYRRSNKKRRRH